MIRIRKTDRFKRLVGKVLVDGQDIGLKQVQAGLAWHFKRYEHEQPPAERDAFRRAEAVAQTAEYGVVGTKRSGRAVAVA